MGRRRVLVVKSKESRIVKAESFLQQARVFEASRKGHASSGDSTTQMASTTPNTSAAATGSTMTGKLHRQDDDSLMMDTTTTPPTLEHQVQSLEEVSCHQTISGTDSELSEPSVSPTNCTASSTTTISCVASKMAPRLPTQEPSLDICMEESAGVNLQEAGNQNQQKQGSVLVSDVIMMDSSNKDAPESSAPPAEQVPKKRSKKRKARKPVVVAPRTSRKRLKQLKVVRPQHLISYEEMMQILGESPPSTQLLPQEGSNSDCSDSKDSQQSSSDSAAGPVKKSAAKKKTKTKARTQTSSPIILSIDDTASTASSMSQTSSKKNGRKKKAKKKLKEQPRKKRKRLHNDGSPIENHFLHPEQNYLTSTFTDTSRILSLWPSDVEYKFSRFPHENQMSVEFVPEDHFLYGINLKENDERQRRVVWRGDSVLKIGTCFGEYRGVYGKLPEVNQSGYAWQVSKEHQVDAEKAGSYLRFVNHFENIGVLPNCKGVATKQEGREPSYRVFFICTKEVYPGDEILTDYGIKAPNGKMDILQFSRDAVTAQIEQEHIELKDRMKRRKISRRKWIQRAEEVKTMLREHS